MGSCNSTVKDHIKPTIDQKLTSVPPDTTCHLVNKSYATYPSEQLHGSLKADISKQSLRLKPIDTRQHVQANSKSLLQPLPTNTSFSNQSAIKQDKCHSLPSSYLTSDDRRVLNKNPLIKLPSSLQRKRNTDIVSVKPSTPTHLRTNCPVLDRSLFGTVSITCHYTLTNALHLFETKTNSHMHPKQSNNSPKILTQEKKVSKNVHFPFCQIVSKIVWTWKNQIFLPFSMKKSFDKNLLIPEWILSLTTQKDLCTFYTYLIDLEMQTDINLCNDQLNTSSKNTSNMQQFNFEALPWMWRALIRLPDLHHYNMSNVALRQLLFQRFSWFLSFFLQSGTYFKNDTQTINKSNQLNDLSSKETSSIRDWNLERRRYRAGLYFAEQYMLETLFLSSSQSSSTIHPPPSTISFKVLPTYIETEELFQIPAEQGGIDGSSFVSNNNKGSVLLLNGLDHTNTNINMICLGHELEPLCGGLLWKKMIHAGEGWRRPTSRCCVKLNYLFMSTEDYPFLNSPIDHFLEKFQHYLSDIQHDSCHSLSLHLDPMISQWNLWEDTMGPTGETEFQTCIQTYFTEDNQTNLNQFYQQIVYCLMMSIRLAVKTMTKGEICVLVIPGLNILSPTQVTTHLKKKYLLLLKLRHWEFMSVIGHHSFSTFPSTISSIVYMPWMIRTWDSSIGMQDIKPELNSQISIRLKVYPFQNKFNDDTNNMANTSSIQLTNSRLMTFRIGNNQAPIILEEALRYFTVGSQGYIWLSSFHYSSFKHFFEDLNDDDITASKNGFLVDIVLISVDNTSQVNLKDTTMSSLLCNTLNTVSTGHPPHTNKQCTRPGSLLYNSVSRAILKMNFEFQQCVEIIVKKIINEKNYTEYMKQHSVIVSELETIWNTHMYNLIDNVWINHWIGNTTSYLSLFHPRLQDHLTRPTTSGLSSMHYPNNDCFVVDGILFIPFTIKHGRRHNKELYITLSKELFNDFMLEGHCSPLIAFVTLLGQSYTAFPIISADSHHGIQHLYSALISYEQSDSLNNPVAHQWSSITSEYILMMCQLLRYSQTSLSHMNGAGILYKTIFNKNGYNLSPDMELLQLFHLFTLCDEHVPNEEHVPNNVIHLSSEPIQHNTKNYSSNQLLLQKSHQIDHPAIHPKSQIQPLPFNSFKTLQMFPLTLFPSYPVKQFHAFVCPFLSLEMHFLYNQFLLNRTIEYDQIYQFTQHNIPVRHQHDDPTIMHLDSTRLLHKDKRNSQHQMKTTNYYTSFDITQNPSNTSVNDFTNLSDFSIEEHTLYSEFIQSSMCTDYDSICNVIYIWDKMGHMYERPLKYLQFINYLVLKNNSFSLNTEFVYTIMKQLLEKELNIQDLYLIQSAHINSFLFPSVTQSNKNNESILITGPIHHQILIQSIELCEIQFMIWSANSNILFIPLVYTMNIPSVSSQSFLSYFRSVVSLNILPDTIKSSVCFQNKTMPENEITSPVCFQMIFKHMITTLLDIYSSYELPKIKNCFLPFSQLYLQQTHETLNVISFNYLRASLIFRFLYKRYNLNRTVTLWGCFQLVPTLSLHSVTKQYLMILFALELLYTAFNDTICFLADIGHPLTLPLFDQLIRHLLSCPTTHPMMIPLEQSDIGLDVPSYEQRLRCQLLLLCLFIRYCRVTHHVTRSDIITHNKLQGLSIVQIILQQIQRIPSSVVIQFISVRCNIISEFIQTTETQLPQCLFTPQVYTINKMIHFKHTWNTFSIDDVLGISQLQQYSLLYSTTNDSVPTFLYNLSPQLISQFFHSALEYNVKWHHVLTHMINNVSIHSIYENNIFFLKSFAKSIIPTIDHYTPYVIYQSYLKETTYLACQLFQDVSAVYATSSIKSLTHIELPLIIRPTIHIFRIYLVSILTLLFQFDPWVGFNLWSIKKDKSKPYHFLLHHNNHNHADVLSSWLYLCNIVPLILSTVRSILIVQFKHHHNVMIGELFIFILIIEGLFKLHAYGDIQTFQNTHRQALCICLNIFSKYTYVHLKDHLINDTTYSQYSRKTTSDQTLNGFIKYETSFNYANTSLPSYHPMTLYLTFILCMIHHLKNDSAVSCLDYAALFREARLQFPQTPFFIGLPEDIPSILTTSTGKYPSAGYRAYLYSSILSSKKTFDAIHPSIKDKQFIHQSMQHTQMEDIPIIEFIQLLIHSSINKQTIPFDQQMTHLNSVPHHWNIAEIVLWNLSKLTPDIYLWFNSIQPITTLYINQCIDLCPYQNDIETNQLCLNQKNAMSESFNCVLSCGLNTVSGSLGIGWPRFLRHDERLYDIAPEYKIENAEILTQGLDIAYSTHPIIIPALKYERIIHIACGDHHTIALTAQGVLYSWGSNFYGQCGLPIYSQNYQNIKQQHDDENQNQLYRHPADQSRWTSGILNKYIQLLIQHNQLNSSTVLKHISLIDDTSQSLLTQSHAIRLPLFSSPFLTQGQHILESLLNDSDEVYLSQFNDQQQSCNNTNEFPFVQHHPTSSFVNAHYNTDFLMASAITIPTRILTFCASKNTKSTTLQFEKVYAGSTFSAARTTNGRLFLWGNTSDGCLGQGYFKDPSLVHQLNDCPTELLPEIGAQHLFQEVCNHHVIFSSELDCLQQSELLQIIKSYFTTRLTNIRYVSCGTLHIAAIDAYGGLWVWGQGEANQLGIPLHIIEQKQTIYSINTNQINHDVNSLPLVSSINQSKQDDDFINSKTIIQFPQRLRLFCLNVTHQSKLSQYHLTNDPIAHLQFWENVSSALKTFLNDLEFTLSDAEIHNQLTCRLDNTAQYLLITFTDEILIKYSNRPNTTTLTTERVHLSEILFSQVSCGEAHTIALGEMIIQQHLNHSHLTPFETTHQLLFSWGQSRFSQLGIDSKQGCSQPINLNLLLNFNYLTASNGITSIPSFFQSTTEIYYRSTPCIINWKPHIQASIGSSDIKNFSTIHIQQINAGGCSNAMLLNNGHLFVWGGNDFGVLGISESRSDITYPEQVKRIPPHFGSIKEFTFAMGAPRLFICSSSGNIICFGKDSYGASGHFFGIPNPCSYHGLSDQKQYSSSNSTSNYDQNDTIKLLELPKVAKKNQVAITVGGGSVHSIIITQIQNVSKDLFHTYSQIHCNSKTSQETIDSTIQSISDETLPLVLPLDDHDIVSQSPLIEKKSRYESSFIFSTDNEIVQQPSTKKSKYSQNHFKSSTSSSRGSNKVSSRELPHFLSDFFSPKQQSTLSCEQNSLTSEQNLSLPNDVSRSRSVYLDNRITSKSKLRRNSNDSIKPYPSIKSLKRQSIQKPTSTTFLLSSRVPNDHYHQTIDHSHNKTAYQSFPSTQSCIPTHYTPTPSPTLTSFPLRVSSFDTILSLSRAETTSPIVQGLQALSSIIYSSVIDGLQGLRQSFKNEIHYPLNHTVPTQDRHLNAHRTIHHSHSINTINLSKTSNLKKQRSLVSYQQEHMDSPIIQHHHSSLCGNTTITDSLPVKQIVSNIDHCSYPSIISNRSCSQTNLYNSAPIKQSSMPLPSYFSHNKQHNYPYDVIQDSTSSLSNTTLPELHHPTQIYHHHRQHPLQHLTHQYDHVSTSTLDHSLENYQTPNQCMPLTRPDICYINGQPFQVIPPTHTQTSYNNSKQKRKPIDYVF